MATHSSVLAWRIPWTEQPGGPPSMGGRVRQDERLTLSVLSKFEKGTYQNWAPRVKWWEVLVGAGRRRGCGGSRDQSPRNKGGKAYLEM